jgi:hypothetical protein
MFTPAFPQISISDRQFSRIKVLTSSGFACVRLVQYKQAGIYFRAGFQKSFDMDVFKWLLALGGQAGGLDENEREIYPA